MTPTGYNPHDINFKSNFRERFFSRPVPRSFITLPLFLFFSPFFPLPPPPILLLVLCFCFFSFSSILSPPLSLSLSRLLLLYILDRVISSFLFARPFAFYPPSSCIGASLPFSLHTHVSSILSPRLLRLLLYLLRFLLFLRLLLLFPFELFAGFPTDTDTHSPRVDVGHGNTKTTMCVHWAHQWNPTLCNVRH